MKVLVIDGPARGEIYETAEQMFIYAVMPANMMDDVKQKSYHVHRFILCGREIRIASVNTLSENISDADAFEAIASPGAKDAAV